MDANVRDCPDEGGAFSRGSSSIPGYIVGPDARRLWHRARTNPVAAAHPCHAKFITIRAAPRAMR